MSEKVELKEKLQAVDQNIRELWDALDDDNKKSLKSEFFILNRYVSNVQSTNRELQEHFVLTVNEYFNKHWNDLQKHPKLLWLLLCMCSYGDGKTYFHQWMGLKKKTGNSKKTRFLEELYPNKKEDEIELLAKIMTDKEVKDLGREYGFDEATLAKKLK
jgi:predicted transcriptional regulator